MSEDGIGTESADTTTTEAPAEGATTESPDTSHFDKLTERMDQFAQQQAELMDRLTAQEPEEEYEDPYPLGEDDDGYDEQEAMRLIDSLIEQRVEERIAPKERADNIAARDRGLDGLTDTYPELADPKVGRGVLEAAQGLLEDLGKPEMIDHPSFVKLVEMTYKAQKADERAQQETPAGRQQQVHLESGGGAAPQEAEEDLQDRITKLAQASSLI